MKARVKATGEIWEFSQIDEITFKSAINGHLYCAEELEFLEPSVFTPDYWTRLEHQYAGMAMQGMLNNNLLSSVLFKIGKTHEDYINEVVNVADEYAKALISRMKNV